MELTKSNIEKRSIKTPVLDQPFSRFHFQRRIGPVLTIT